jgi:hypothetical protein
VPSVFSCTQREEVQARPFREKGYGYGIIVNLRRHSRSTSLVREQIETSKDVVLEEEIAFQRSKESQMEIDSETIPSPPSAVQRETDIIPADPVAPIDMFRDIAVGHKRLA